MRCPAIRLRVVAEEGMKNRPLADVLVGVGLSREWSVCFHTRRHQRWQGICVGGYSLDVEEFEPF